MKTAFLQGYPSFRLRFMYMTGIDDDDKFNEFISKISLEEIAEKIERPILFVAGKYDNLCPHKYVKRFYDRIKAEKLFIIYDREFHALGNVFGEAYDSIADWLNDRFKGKPVPQGWKEIPSP
jgi:fermentation-respiration switch protein FrsA (DUF1100 family)